MSNRDLQNIWAPWRIKYILNNKPDKECVFCTKANADTSQDRDNLVLERGEHVYALMNTFPYNPGHLLVCPYEHCAEPEELSAETLQEIWSMTLKWKKYISAVLHPQGVNIGLNLGSAAGAGIAAHMHMHIVPRWTGDTNFMTTCSSTRVISQSLNELYDLLIKTTEEE